MTDFQNCLHEFVTEFTDLSKSCSCLQRIESFKCSNRDLKKKAYDGLVQMLKEVDIEANKDAISISMIYYY
jgi:hypothetical protein